MDEPQKFLDFVRFGRVSSRVLVGISRLVFLGFEG
jgi:hypothetical protein